MELLAKHAERIGRGAETWNVAEWKEFSRRQAGIILLRTEDSMSPIGLPGAAIALAAFVVVYLTVFGAGLTFLLRMMAHPPVPDEPGVPHLPLRSAGITPAPALGLADERTEHKP